MGSPQISIELNTCGMDEILDLELEFVSGGDLGPGPQYSGFPDFNAIARKAAFILQLRTQVRSNEYAVAEHRIPLP
ncbi:hypothetical protein [Methylobacterium sp. WSM2598]|uniref:hypothetical protein n=1 Tax=Methylobacterium sp. WSM2598 TaxID=398261 RepID=UPI0012F64FE1|nr:hypothetical protein [Methylobacterium sp. WSM2598]